MDSNGLYPSLPICPTLPIYLTLPICVTLPICPSLPPLWLAASAMAAIRHSEQFVRLQNAASQVIRKLRLIPELQNARIAIIGGLAVCRYLPGYRDTQV